MSKVYSADEILKIKTPEILFQNSLDETRKTYRELIKTWHPDVCKDAKGRVVFEHVKKLYDGALAKLTNGFWGHAGVFTHHTVSYPYLREAQFELGKCLIAQDRLFYVLNAKDYSEYMVWFGCAAAGFKYANATMEKEVKRYLPVHFSYEKNVLTIIKDPEMYCLRDVLNYYGGAMEPRHVAWILSTVYNLLCYFQYSKITHNDISPDTYFIKPKDHSGALLGGWWYSVKEGVPILKIPLRTFEYIPFKVRSQKIACSITDAELVLALGRELLGDIRGTNLHKDTPKALESWLNSVAKEGAVDNYKLWQEVLTKSFGPRKFVNMSVSSSILY